MDPGFYRAAVKGSIDKFMGIGKEIESILTPNKNTILHVHLTGKTDMISKNFVEEMILKWPALVEEPIVNVKGETILHIAARYGHSKIVQKIIELAKGSKELGAEKRLIRATNDKKDMALHEAVRYQHTEVVRLLVDEDMDLPYFANNDGETPLYIAAERNCKEAVDKILEKWSSVPYHEGPKGRTVLHTAVLHGDKDIVEKLLKRTSLTTQQDENGWVPLHLAVLRDDSILAELLLKYDRSAAYMTDNKGRTPLHFVACFGNSNIMDKIMEHCPDSSELVDKNGCNALHYTTILKNKHVASRILQEESLSNLYNEKDENGDTPLHHLARHAPTWDRNDHHPLLEGKPRVDVMAFNKDNQTVLDVAYDRVPSPVAYKNFFLRRLQKIKARFGRRDIDKDVRKKKQAEKHEYYSGGDESMKQRESDEARVKATVAVVAALIATVTFTAAFTIPGGTIQDVGDPHKGSPLLKHSAAFQAFVITNTLSFVLSASAVLLQILLSFLENEENYRESFGFCVMATLWLTMLAMVFMILAFATGTYAVVGASKGLGVITLLVALSFFVIYPLIYYIVFKVSKEEVYEKLRPGLPLFHPERRSFVEMEEALLSVPYKI